MSKHVHHLISFVSSFFFFLLLSPTLHLNVLNVVHGSLITLTLHLETMHQTLKPSVAEISQQQKSAYIIYLFTSLFYAAYFEYNSQVIIYSKKKKKTIDKT